MRRTNRLVIGGVVLLGALGTVALLEASARSDADHAQGKLYIVGMGTAPDLITLRAINVIREADIVLLHDPQGAEDWKQYVSGKEVWILERFSLLFMGLDPDDIEDPQARELARKHARARREIVERIRKAVESGKIVAVLEGGDPMMYGVTFYLERLPEDIPSEIVPGVGAFQAASAAVKMNPPYGWDTNSVILTMDDWEGRTDTNEKLMATQTSMVFYTMHLDYPRLFEQLRRRYPLGTPVAIVCYAGDPKRQKVIRSTVSTFFDDVDLKTIPLDKHMLMVGKFLKVGQARKDGLLGGKKFMEAMRYEDRVKKRGDR